MACSDSTVVLTRAFALWCGVVAVAALYVAREVLLPLALAILFSFLLAPSVKRLEKWHLRRIPAVVIAVGFAFVALGTLSYVLAMQMVDLATRLPEYKGNIIAKIETVQGTGEGLFNRISHTLDEVRRKIAHKVPDMPSHVPAPAGAAGADAASPTPASGTPVVPMPVEIVGGFSAQAIAQSVLGPIISPVGTAALVVVFVVFMLIERENLRNRIIHLIGSRQLNVATQALDDAASRVSRYLLMQLIINSAFGFVIAVGLFCIGVPNPLVWGILATVLRFLPYIGSWIAAALPILLAAAVFQGWTRPILVLALFIASELTANNLLEPWLYGASTGISTMGILVSAVFWAWLWGPVGLVMATPLTVCLAVMGRYVPHLSFLHTLLSDEEVLSPDARFYQRLLAMDPEEATDVAEEYLQDHGLGSLYDNVLLPALSLAEQDRLQGDLDESRQRFIIAAIRELVDELGAKVAKSTGASTVDRRCDEPHALPAPHVSIVCLPARDEADEIAGVMLGQLLAADGIHLMLVSVQALAGEMLAQVSDEAPAVVCVSALPPLAAMHARYLCKRLRPKFPQLKIVVGLWQAGGSSKKAQDRLAKIGIDRFVTSLAEATQYLAHFVASQRLLAGNGAATNA
ncbi:MAG TPA: AI-2E family transporter [Pirellulales bacterium]|jgi:predicted PurR-regulated permease PerM|nr:AI-2E family transporter [Pirellulales bacterium]